MVGVGLLVGEDKTNFYTYVIFSHAGIKLCLLLLNVSKISCPHYMR